MRGGGLVSVLDAQSLFFFLKENWICATTRHHAEPNINMLLTRNLPFDSDVRQWSHPLMIPLHCLWAKSNNKTRDQFECDVSWFRFCFDFVRSHAGCGPLHKQEYKDTKKQIMRLSFETGWEGRGGELGFQCQKI